MATNKSIEAIGYNLKQLPIKLHSIIINVEQIANQPEKRKNKDELYVTYKSSISGRVPKKEADKENDPGGAKRKTRGAAERATCANTSSEHAHVFFRLDFSQRHIWVHLLIFNIYSKKVIFK